MTQLPYLTCTPPSSRCSTQLFHPTSNSNVLTIGCKMPVQSRSHGPHKRKQPEGPQRDSSATKKSRTAERQPQTQSLIAPHQPILAQLAPKYNVLAASVISSTPIRKRIVYVVNHLIKESSELRVALLYARTADVCKLITVVEQCKRVLGEEGKAWYQYNQLFDQPEAEKKKHVVEETVLENEEDDGSDSDDFEVMHSRFEEAVLPPPTTRTVKSMRVFLSLAPIPELRVMKDVTAQTCEGRKKLSDVVN